MSSSPKGRPFPFPATLVANGGAQWEKPSRSAKKRHSAALQKLGEELAAMPAASRADMNLPSELEEALALHDRITDREGARRQRQYIGRLMRGIDVQAIERELALRRNARAAHVAEFHEAEKWRAALLEASETELPGLVAKISAKAPDSQPGEAALLALAGKARKERNGGSGNNGPRACRQLFRALAEILKAGRSAARPAPDCETL